MSRSWVEGSVSVGPTQSVDDAPLPDLASVHARHADFVFASLQRLGIRGASIEDAHQEVFLIVHRRLSSYDGRSCMTAWLFGICRRVAAAHRRKAHVRREVPIDPDCEIDHVEADPEEQFARGEARRKAHSVLDMLDIDRRAVLIMFELEGMQCEKIAALLGIPVGTVYSRLHAARRDFENAMVRFDAREANGRRGLW